MMKYASSAILIDTRPSADFAQAHYRGSINIPFNKSFTNWAGWFVKYDQDIVIMASAGDVPNIRKALASIGFDRIVGVIEPSAAIADPQFVESYKEIDVHQLHERLDDDSYYLVDVRNQTEWDEGKIPGAKHIMLGTVLDRLSALPEGKTYIVQCRSGQRSALAASLLQASGSKNVLNVKGGYLDWTKAKLPVTK